VKPCKQEAGGPTRARSRQRFAPPGGAVDSGYFAASLDPFSSRFGQMCRAQPVVNKGIEQNKKGEAPGYGTVAARVARLFVS
jgi:hypothetical protein